MAKKKPAPRTELVLFNVLYEDDTLESQVERYLEDDRARREIAARGTRLVLGHHTYLARASELLKRVARRRVLEGVT